VVPVVVDDCTHIGSIPFSTVIRLEFPANQVTLVVTSTGCPPAVASAVRHVVAVELTGSVIESGLITTLVTFPRVTVALVVAVAVPEAAVIVLVPAETAVSRPPVLSVATVGSELDQHTVVPVQVVPAVRVSGFPLLSVAAAVNCTGAPPTLTVGLGGTMVMLETVGFTKNPLQLTASANIASAVRAPARRSLCFADDIVVSDSSGAPVWLNNVPGSIVFALET
jgi:hypothetical protein